MSHAGETLFLVNGSTAAILAAVGASCPVGSTLVASRASHVSVFNAAALAGVCLLQRVAAAHRRPSCGACGALGSRSGNARPQVVTCA